MTNGKKRSVLLQTRKNSHYTFVNYQYQYKGKYKYKRQTIHT